MVAGNEAKCAFQSRRPVVHVEGEVTVRVRLRVEWVAESGPGARIKWSLGIRRFRGAQSLLLSLLPCVGSADIRLMAPCSTIRLCARGT